MTTPDPLADARLVLRHLIDLNEPHIDLQGSANEPSAIDGLSWDRCHEALLNARDAGWIDGELNESGQGFYLWVHLFVRPDGMRAVEAWPPAGREYLPGRWDEDHWGRWALPCLRRTAEDPAWAEMPASFGMGPITDAHRVYVAMRVLRLADYIDARFDATSVAGARLTVTGRAALSAAPPSHIARARLLLASERNVSRALIDLVEGEVADIMTAVATAREVGLVDRNGKPLEKLRQRIDRLASEEALSGIDAAILRVALEARNAIAHTTTDELTQTRELVDWIIDGVEHVQRHTSD